MLLEFLWGESEEDGEAASEAVVEEFGGLFGVAVCAAEGLDRKSVV